MWIVRLALRRPYTFVVMAMLIVLLGIVTIVRMPTDIFPSIEIPVISVIWNYAGLPPREMEGRIVSNYERLLTTTVNDIEHIESQTLAGVSVIKIFLHPGARVDAATAEVTAISQTFLRALPPGATPPLIIRYSASNVPILQVALESDDLSEQQVFDLTANFLRTGLATVQGAQIPWPYGGRQREVVVDIDLQRLQGWGLSPGDVTAAINAQNLILPTGTAKIGTVEYPILLNSSPVAVRDLGALPVKTVRGTVLYLRDVANVRDGFQPQTSVVHANGRRAVLLSILKSGGASTLDIVARVRASLPRVLATLPPSLKATLLFDQSLFVRAAVDGVMREAAIAAALTGLMILLFLGSLRSTLIVIVSIPLSILVSVIVLSALGQTLNLMTLGGMALAVGILVDDATVEIENIHRNLAQRKPLVTAILDGARQIAVPAFVSTLAICIVFVPVAFISGAARFLFVPLALAVVFAMLSSYLLSRTLVPTLCRYLLAEHAGHEAEGRGRWARFLARFERGFARLRARYGTALAFVLSHRGATATVFGIFAAGSFALYPLLGNDFFPRVDAGLIRLHVRAPPGTRIEQTEPLFERLERAVRAVVPPGEIETIIDNLGVPMSSINLALSDGSLISSADGEMLIALRKEHHPTEPYVAAIRRELHERFPELTTFFLAPDMTTQVLNFGLAAPIDLQLTGPATTREANLALARELRDRVAAIPGAVDVHLQQVPDGPELRVAVDRTRASEVGLTQRDVATDVLVALSSSAQTAPSYWLDTTRGVQYMVAVQTPQYQIDSIDALLATPLTAPGQRPPQLLANVATVARGSGPVNVTHWNAANTYDVLAGVDGADLGSVASRVDAAIAAVRARLPRGTTIEVRGQAESMRASFRGLAFGLIFAVVLVYLLMVVNFQSWLDPFVILMALPGALSGIVWMLFVSRTTLSVPALMGAIMSVGVATANSILLVTFANDQRRQGADATRAALAAGMTRLRPVLMTALAMIIGMLPMSLGLGEGGEQNAPLGRAVIGGLLFATVATLFFVPVMYSLLRRRPPVAHDLEI